MHTGHPSEHLPEFDDILSVPGSAHIVSQIFPQVSTFPIQNAKRNCNLHSLSLSINCTLGVLQVSGALWTLVGSQLCRNARSHPEPTSSAMYGLTV